MKKAMLSFVMGLGLAAGAWGQTHKVAPKPETVVRAVGVYEWTGDLAKPTGSRFVPVTLYIDGELEDAGNYKPQPVPFALLSGNIYELEDAGLSQGTVVLESAMRAMTPEGAPAPAFIDGWTAYGAYKAPASAKKSSAPLQASKTVPTIQVNGGDPNRPHLNKKSDDSSAPQSQDSPQASKTDGAANKKDGSASGDDAGRPTLHRKTGDDTATKQDSTATKQDGTTTKQDSTTTDSNANKKDSPAPADDPDRPTMHRRTSSDDTASNDSGGSSKVDPNDPADRPTLKKRSPEEEKKQQKKKNDTATVTAVGAIEDDPDRPRLRHSSVGSQGESGPPKLMGVPKDMRQMVAVSDARDRDPHPFARPWEDANERAGVLAKMQAFAREKLTAYGVVPGVTPATAVARTAAAPAANSAAVSETPDGGPPKLKRGIPSKASVTTAPIPPAASAPAPAKAAPAKTTRATAKGKRAAAPTPAQTVLADEDLKGYTLSYGGDATYVYMAHTVETGSVMRYVTIVAQDDGMGQLKIALASVTDAAHLDRTPWMRLVDVVDAEASNRASLLFEMRGQSSRQFALYRVIAAKPEQIFVTGS